MISLTLLCALGLAASPKAAADTIDTFGVTGTFSFSPSVLGTTFDTGNTVAIDITDGLVTVSDLIVSGPDAVPPATMLYVWDFTASATVSI